MALRIVTSLLLLALSSISLSFPDQCMQFTGHCDEENDPCRDGHSMAAWEACDKHMVEVFNDTREKNKQELESLVALSKKKNIEYRCLNRGSRLISQILVETNSYYSIGNEEVTPYVNASGAGKVTINLRKNLSAVHSFVKDTTEKLFDFFDIGYADLSIKEAVDKGNSDLEGVLGLVKNISRKISRYQRISESFSRILEANFRDIKSLKSECDEYLDVSFDELQVNLKTLNEEENRVRSELASINSTFSAIVRKLSLFNESRVSVELVNRTRKTISEIKSLFQEVKITIELSNYADDWLGQFGPDVANRLDTYYLKYEAPLRLMRLRISSGEVVANQLRANLHLNDGALSYPLESVERKISILKNRLQPLEEKGWQGQLQRQQFFVKKLREKLSILPRICKSIFDEYDASGAADLKAFRVKENLYQNVIENCRKAREDNR